MKPAFFRKLILNSFVLVLLAACQKQTVKPANETQVLKAKLEKDDKGHLKQTRTFSSHVAIKWMDMQLRLMKANPTVMANVAFSRPFVYSGVALYEAVVPGMPAYQSIAGQTSGLSGLPNSSPGLAYNWALTANAALAYMNKHFFQTANPANKLAIDSLEAALYTEYSSNIEIATSNRSVVFGKTIAQKVFDWAETDGYLMANNSYTAPPSKTGPAFWVPPLAPSIQTAAYWGNVRRIVPASGDGAQAGAPPSYSDDPASEFYKMAKEVYDLSPAPASKEEAMAMFWRDVPGTSTPGHYVSILKQILVTENPDLGTAAYAYALAGIVVFDASISNWETKFMYNLVRPVTYIRTVLNHPSWSPSLINTPPHPEYPSAHSTLSAANAEALTIVFGDNYSYTDHTFDYLGFASRFYSSFREGAEEAGLSRLYGGIHYRKSIEVGIWQGRKVAQNITSRLKFLKS